MKYNPEIHHRRSIRLKGYDYSKSGMYFITPCVQNRLNLFGKIDSQQMVLNDAGKMIERWWLEMTNKFPNIENDIFVVMPNHFHGIIIIREITKSINVASVGADLRVCPNSMKSDINGDELSDIEFVHDELSGENFRGGGLLGEYGVMGEHGGSPLRDTRYGLHNKKYCATIGDMVRWFKTMTTNEYIRCVKQFNWRPFEKKLWQRNYYEHIIRDEPAFQRISQYIINNPKKWGDDKLCK